MAHIRDTDYLYISSRLKALEKDMLKSDKLARLASARNVDEAYKLLAENGWSDPAADIEKAIAARRQATFDLLYRYAPDGRIIDFFRLKYDYHNIKAIVKAEAVDTPISGLLSDAGTIPPREMETALREKDAYRLPQDMLNAAVEAQNILERTSDPQLSDLLLDKAMAKQMAELAKATKSEFLQGYVRLFTDCANLRLTVRAVRTQKGFDYLNRALLEDSSVTPKMLAGEITPELLIKLFGKGELLAAAKIAALALEGGTLGALDMACDNTLIEYVRKARFIAFGEAHVVSYLLAVEGELTAVRMILAGLEAGLSSEKITERLRESYV